jgi:hypothetical protein
MASDVSGRGGTTQESYLVDFRRLLRLSETSDQQDGYQ